MEEKYSLKHVKPTQQKIFFYYSSDQEQDYTKIYTCNSYLFKSSNKYKCFIKELLDIHVKLYTTCSMEKKYTEFKTGTLMFENKEFKIINFDLYYYLTINDKIETRIATCQIEKDLFLQLKKLEEI